MLKLINERDYTDGQRSQRGGNGGQIFISTIFQEEKIATNHKRWGLQRFSDFDLGFSNMDIIGVGREKEKIVWQDNSAATPITLFNITFAFLVKIPNRHCYHHHLGLHNN